MIGLSTKTYLPEHTHYKSTHNGRKLHVMAGADEGNVVKAFNIGNTRIKICDDYCYDKTPEAVQAILDRIAFRVQSSLAMQQALSQSPTE